MKNTMRIFRNDPVDDSWSVWVVASAALMVAVAVPGIFAGLAVAFVLAVVGLGLILLVVIGYSTSAFRSTAGPRHLFAEALDSLESLHRDDRRAIGLRASDLPSLTAGELREVLSLTREVRQARIELDQERRATHGAFALARSRARDQIRSHRQAAAAVRDARSRMEE